MIIAIITKVKNIIHVRRVYIKNNVLRKNEVIITEVSQEQLPNNDDFIKLIATTNKENASVLKKITGIINLFVLENPSTWTINA